MVSRAGPPSGEAPVLFSVLEGAVIVGPFATAALSRPRGGGSLCRLQAPLQAAAGVLESACTTGRALCHTPFPSGKSDRLGNVSIIPASPYGPAARHTPGSRSRAPGGLGGGANCAPETAAPASPVLLGA